MTIKRFIAGSYRTVKEKVCMALFRILPVNKKRIMFMSHYGKHINCNPYAIYTRMKEKNMDYEYIWVDNSKRTPEKSVKYRSVRFYYYLRTSGVLVFNARPNIDIKKRNNQFYVQTWHASLGLKMIEKNAVDSLVPKYVKRSIKDSTYINVLVSGSEFQTSTFKEDFWYDGFIASTGTPRNDVLFSPNAKQIIEDTKKEIGVKSDEKIFLYAPTFRSNGDISYALSMDPSELSTALTERFGGDWRIVYRLHPNVVLPEGAIDGSVINATSYSDAQGLIMAADILVTDYSSIMFDYMLLNKPVLLYCPDLEDYVKNERRTNFKIEELPFSLSRSNGDLVAAIKHFNNVEYCEKAAELLKIIGSYEDGNASERIIKIISDRI